MSMVNGWTPRRIGWRFRGFRLSAVVPGEGERKKKPRMSPLRYPGFPVKIGGVDKPYAPFL
jgi:hypothetical protein